MNRARCQPGRTRMATTIVACALRFDRAVVAHVGDSRCYLIRHGRATLLTRDHTVVNEQVRLGILSAREAAEADTRHLLSRSLGTDLFVNVEITDIRCMPDDILLLCSDGLHGAVRRRRDRQDRRPGIPTSKTAAAQTGRSLPTSGMAAIISASSWSAFAMSNGWACIADGRTNCADYASSLRDLHALTRHLR